MAEQVIDAEAVLAELKDFQQRTARWAFQRMFDEKDPAIRFLVADEVGLGKTHVAKGVIAQVIDHLRRTGDKRHDIVYVCSNAAIARQNIRKLVPAGIKPIEGADRLTMLPLAQLDDGDGTTTGINLLPITPGTSLKFGRSTGTFPERCLAYTFLRAHWGAGAMNAPARRIFWEGLWAGDRYDRDGRLRSWEQWYQPRIGRTLGHFAELLEELDKSRHAQGKPIVRRLFDELAEGLAWKRTIPYDLHELRRELIGEVRRVMARVGIAALQPDLIVLDEFQRFKDLLRPEPGNFAAESAHRLFNHRDPETGRATRTLLLSATPYRMYTISDEMEDDHYRDFLDTCSFLFQDPARVERLEGRFRALRTALTAADPGDAAEDACQGVGNELRAVMARTERLSATPDRDGMLSETDTQVAVMDHDLRAYLRIGALADAVAHHEPTEYWKSAPYLVNFMEAYKLKQAVAEAAERGLLGGEELDPGPGLLSWDDIEEYRRIDPQNGRLRWLLDDLERSRAFELLWVPPSMRYYDTGSVYESPEAAGFTKRLIFSGWTVVPKVVSSLVSFEAERRAFENRSHRYTAGYRQRGGQRLVFRTTERAGQPRPGEAAGDRRAAAMTAFLLTWPSPSLARLGDPRPQVPRQRSQAPGIGGTAPPAPGDRVRISDVLEAVAARLADAVEPLVRDAPTDGAADQRWYWAAPLFLDQQRAPEVIDLLLGPDGAWYWEDDAGQGLQAHVAEARAMIDHGPGALGRPPGDLVEVLAELAVGGPAQCALRMVSSVCGLPVSADEGTVEYAAWIGAAFRHFFNAPEVTAVVAGGHSEQPDADEGESRYWRDVVRHSIDGNLQAVLDEHGHVVRDWLGHLSLGDDDRRWDAAFDISGKLAEALELRTSSYRVDIPMRERNGRDSAFDQRRMRTRFAVAFANQTLDDGGEARVGAVSAAFNSPFWPFVLASTSIGQEGLDFHLWCHAVVHWNLPYNPVDLEQREGRVHRYKGHAVRRNIASTLGPELFAGGLTAGADPWDGLFSMAAERGERDSEMVPYWVFNEGPAKIERHVPVMPFSQEAAALPRLRKALAAYRLAFGQPRQEELVELLGTDRSDEDLMRLTERFRIDLSPPESTQ
ncbi:MAG: helicase-related protein [Acidimicrobiaceae bacterium]|nr:helicase-related protein [Acidimicrobiaceae bacterium]